MTNPTKTVIKNANRTNKHNDAKFSYRGNSLEGFTLQATNGPILSSKSDQTVVVLNHAEALELARELLAFVATANAGSR
jgi:hypothetical protein